MKGWIATWVVLLLLLVDIATLAFAKVVADQQQGTIDALHTGVCRNAQVLTDQIRVQIKQSSNTDLYRQFFPQIPHAQLRQVIAAQVTQYRAEIDQLQRNCAES